MAVCGSLGQHSQPYNLIIDVGVSTSSGHDVKLVAPRVCTSVLRRTCTCTCWLSTRALHGYRDCGTRACFLKILQHLMGLAQAISVSGKVVSSAQHSLRHLAMSRYTRDYVKSSSRFFQGMGSFQKYIFRMEQEGLSWLFLP